jgi:hypothetical protein
VAIFDDSFEHEAWNDDHSIVRSVLLVDVWHPELTEEDRESVRRDFAYSRSPPTADGAPGGVQVSGSGLKIPLKKGPFSWEL